ncbi:MAG: FtsQ-type POTRA domain-containing protein [Eubacteriales bacterium]|nr:FtsQ-type POTRA domain-containing protein [Candidatus Colimorpha enterica]
MNSADINAEPNGGLNNAELVNKDSFERLRSKNRHKEFRRKIFYLFVSLLLCAVVGTVCVVFFFGLKHVEVRGNGKYTSDEIIASCGFEGSENLFGIDLASLRTKLQSSYPYIRNVSFRRVLPSTLIITVEEDSPAWFTDIYGEWFILSPSLRVISRFDMREEIDVQELGVTYIKLPPVRSAVAGSNVSFVRTADYGYFVSFLSEIKGYSFFSESIDSIDASDRYRLTVYSSGGKYKINLGTSDNLEAKVRFVTKVIETAFDSTTIASVDVEYLTSVIVLKQTEPFIFPER